MRSNCLVWAVGQWWRHGGYLALRRTRQAKWRWAGWWPHFLWSPDLKTWSSFVPERAERVWSPPLWFQGKIVEGDDRCTATPISKPS